MIRPSADAKIRVGVLGATGSVGQRFVQLVCGGDHPWLEVTALGASERSAGKTYQQAVNWKLSRDIPAAAAVLAVSECKPEFFVGKCDAVVSGMDAAVAGPVEEAFAASGLPVFSNAKNHRFDERVPILIPTVNPDHLAAVEQQPHFAAGGFIVTNPNCSSTGIAVALAPLAKEFGLRSLWVATLQATSGAGYPGLPFSDVYDNVIPFISGEEEKIEAEPKKIFGTYSASDGFMSHDLLVSTHCHRVATTDGHQCSASVRLDPDSVGTYTKEQMADLAKKAISRYRPPQFREVDVQQLPSCANPVLRLREEPDRPQPRLDRDDGNGYATAVGRVRPCNLLDLRFTCLAHNTVAGGAGGSILNLELAIACGMVKRKECPV